MHDVHRIPIGEGGEGSLEPPLADIAPGTDEVGPDVDAHEGIVTRE
jgi:hypothetical protein